MSEPTNEERALFVRDALEKYASKKGDDFSVLEDADTVVLDFMADLLHFCDLYGVDFEYCAAMGRTHYNAEKGYYEPPKEEATND